MEEKGVQRKFPTIYNHVPYKGKYHALAFTHAFLHDQIFIDLQLACSYSSLIHGYNI